MKKSIIAIAFLLLCPFYGVRAQERPFFDLSGKGWHLWQDKKDFLSFLQHRNIHCTTPPCNSCNISFGSGLSLKIFFSCSGNLYRKSLGRSQIYKFFPLPSPLLITPLHTLFLLSQEVLLL